jgi:hypothetical protein
MLTWARCSQVGDSSPSTFVSDAAASTSSTGLSRSACGAADATHAQTSRRRADVPDFRKAPLTAQAGSASLSRSMSA